ncbi:hypothetical protein KPL76_00055 [Subtercola sp. PAMC28395]|nr:hypothetical protein [Subtercola sp. PAMC28395]QWT23890.1 hypothetical protein KPL76_00055 [Subtercola sp. PAMC28395]
MFHSLRGVSWGTSPVATRVTRTQLVGFTRFIGLVGVVEVSVSSDRGA